MFNPKAPNEGQFVISLSPSPQHPGSALKQIYDSELRATRALAQNIAYGVIGSIGQIVKIPDAHPKMRDSHDGVLCEAYNVGYAHVCQLLYIPHPILSDLGTPTSSWHLQIEKAVYELEIVYSVLLPDFKDLELKK